MYLYKFHWRKAALKLAIARSMRKHGGTFDLTSPAHQQCNVFAKYKLQMHVTSLNQ